MAIQDIGGALRRMGLQLVGVVRTQFGAGVTSKTAAVMCAAIAGFVLLGVFMPDAPYKPWMLLLLLAFCAVWLLGTWIHTSKNPLHSVEGEQIVELYRDAMAAKGIGSIPAYPAVAKPTLDSIASDGPPR